MMFDPFARMVILRRLTIVTSPATVHLKPGLPYSGSGNI
jgi:hypothetical protein